MLRRQMLTTLALVGLFFLVPAESLYGFLPACSAYDDPDDRAECEDEQEQQQADDDDTLDQMEREALAEAVDTAIDAVVNAADTVMGAVGTVVSAVANAAETLVGAGETVAEPVCEIVIRYSETVVEECWPAAIIMAGSCTAAGLSLAAGQVPMAGAGGLVCVGSTVMTKRCVERTIREKYEEEVCEE